MPVIVFYLHGKFCKNIFCLFTNKEFLAVYRSLHIKPYFSQTDLSCNPIDYAESGAVKLTFVRALQVLGTFVTRAYTLHTELSILVYYFRTFKPLKDVISVMILATNGISVVLFICQYPLSSKNS